MNTIDNSDRKSYFLFAERLRSLDHPFDEQFLIEEYLCSDRGEMALRQRIETFEQTFPILKELILKAYFDHSFRDILKYLEELKDNFSLFGAVYHKELCSIAIEKLQVKNYKDLEALLEDICQSQEIVTSFIKTFLNRK